MSVRILKDSKQNDNFRIEVQNLFLKAYFIETPKEVATSKFKLKLKRFPSDDVIAHSNEHSHDVTSLT